MKMNGLTTTKIDTSNKLKINLALIHIFCQDETASSTFDVNSQDLQIAIQNFKAYSPHKG